MTSHFAIPARPQAESGVSPPQASATNNEFNGLNANLVIPSGGRFMISGMS
jgi:hypothetical protein